MNKLNLYSIFQSNMVLQRQKPISVWGNAPADSIVTVHLSSDSSDNNPVSLVGTSVSTKAEVSGNFFVSLPAQEAARNCTLTISCGDQDDEKITLSNISIGDVWLACGQSNMEFFLRYEKDWKTVKQYPQNPDIHVYNIPQTAFEGHLRSNPGYGRWMQEGDAHFDTFSAPGYSFARHIQPHIQVPVGIIGCNWGGTTATAWLDESNLADSPLDIYLKEYEAAIAQYSPEEMKEISLKAWEFEDSPEHGADFEPLLYGRDHEWQQQYIKDHASDPVIPMGPYNINRPGGLYHRMLEPLIPFPIKGALWYQGESDAGHSDIYDVLLSTLIQAWRKKWNDEFPFLFVQLAPFGVWLECTSENFTEVREKQELVSKTVPNTGMISIMDIGSYYDIHPKEKMEVGRRLALLARGKVYGESILCEAPHILSAKRKDATIELTFDHCTELHSDGRQNDFALSQSGKALTIDSIAIHKNTLCISSSQMAPGPITISLGYADYAEIHIYNEADLPVMPFSVCIG